MIENQKTRQSAKSVLHNFFTFYLQKIGKKNCIIYEKREKYKGGIHTLVRENYVDIAETVREYEFKHEILDELIELEKKKHNRKRVIACFDNSKRHRIRLEKIIITEKDVQKIKIVDIDDYIRNLKSEYRKKRGCEIEKNTIAIYLGILKKYFHFLSERDIIEKNVISKDYIKTYKKNSHKKVISLPLDESKRLISTANNPRDKAIILTFLSSGVRNNELCNLKMHDIDYEQKIISVFEGKGDKDREVIFTEKCKRAILDWVEVREYCKPKNDYVFVSCSGRQLTDCRINDILNKIGAKANIKINNSNGKRTKVHAHLLRHTYATQYLKAGGNLVALQENMGHSSLETTRQYIDLSMKFKQQDYEKTMGSLF